MKAVYAGSFDCYTNGHHDIVRRASRLFDELHVLIAVNSEKRRAFPAEAMKRAIEAALLQDGITNCRVTICGGLVAEYCTENGISYSVRGLRNNVDFNYEENVAEVNRLVSPSVETIYFRSSAPALSSSMVRELRRYGRDVSAFVPREVREMLDTCEN